MNRVAQLVFRCTALILIIIFLALALPAAPASGNGSFNVYLPAVKQETCPPGMFIYPPANACVIIAPAE